MKLKLLTLFLIVLSFLIVGCESKPQQATQIETSSESKSKEEILKADSYILTTTKGEKITFEVANGVMLSPSLNGKMVLFNFWATWCNPCLKEMPTFVKLQEKYKNDFLLIGILFERDKDVKELKTFMKKYKINFPITVGGENFVLAEAFDDVKKIPESFLYSKDGFFVEKFIGEIKEEKLESYIKESMK